jgi:hypothetical protein
MFLLVVDLVSDRFLQSSICPSPFVRLSGNGDCSTTETGVS